MIIKFLRALLGLNTPGPIAPEPESKGDGFFIGEYRTTAKTPRATATRTLGDLARESLHYAPRVQTADGQAMVSDYDIKELFNGQGSIPQAQLDWFQTQSFIGYQACAMLAQHWLINLACGIPGEDAIRNGYTVSVASGAEVPDGFDDAVRDADKRFKVRANCEQAARFNRIFGIRHILFLVESDDPEYYELPFNPDGVLPGRYRGISQIDPYWVTPELDAKAVTDPSDPHFYEPTYWRIRGKRYHRSHFVILRFREVPDILKPSYLYGGIPLTQQIAERVYAAEKSANEAPQLLMTKRLNSLHTNVDEAIANQEKFDSRMAEWVRIRDNYGVRILGKSEEMEQFDTTLSDTDEVIMTQYQLVASVAEMPATKLLQTSPKGFNATGEYEADSYHEKLESIQSHEFAPIIERHHQLLMRSELKGRFNMDRVLRINIEWAPLDVPTAKEQADIGLVKAQTRQAYVAAGAIDGMDIRDLIKEEPDSGFAGLADIEIEPPSDG